jgi:hypothetical protein
VNDRLAGRSVTARELEWAKNVGEQEEEMEEAEELQEMEQEMMREMDGCENLLVAASNGKAMGDNDMGGQRIERPNVPSAPLTAGGLGDQTKTALPFATGGHDGEDPDFSSGTSSVASAASALKPNGSSRKMQTRSQRRSARNARTTPYQSAEQSQRR